MQFKKIKEITEKINQKSKENEHTEKLLEIQSRLEGDFLNIVEPHRKYLAEGEFVKMWGDKQETLHFFLFNDMFMFTIPKKGLKPTYQYVSFFIISRTLTVIDVVETDQKPITSMIFKYPHLQYLVGFKDLKQKKDILSKLKIAQDEMTKLAITINSSSSNDTFKVARAGGYLNKKKRRKSQKLETKILQTQGTHIVLLYK